MAMKDQSAKGRGKLIVAAVIAFLILLVAGGKFAVWWMHRPIPFGIAARVAWTVSKVEGTPEPPDPFITERVFPNLKFFKPLDINFEPGGNHVVVAQHEGQILWFANDPAAKTTDQLLDVRKLPSLADIKGKDGSETIGFAFDPDFQKNHFCYICYHADFPWKLAAEFEKAYPQNANATHVSRFTISQATPPVIDPASEQILITWPANGHNGGCLKFGPDGYLYISTGDNGDPNPPDPHSVGQNVGDLRAKILRIDVNHPNGDKPYSIPADNPFVKTPEARGEVFAYGLRNPWRFSFDHATGDLWAGDVGWELWESVVRVVAGGNYGWSINEGPQPVHIDGKRGPTPFLRPEIALPHTEAASITGGIVYHGKRLPELQNNYLFGDWETRRLWAAPVEGKKLGKYRTIAQTDLRIVSFGEDADGECYIVDYESGKIFRVAPNPGAASEGKFPRKLSETGLFADVAAQVPSPGVVSFNINTPQWVDGSTSVRFIAVPGNDAVTEGDEGKLIFPKNTVLARTLSLPIASGDDQARKNVETQILHFDGKQWHAYSYQWDSAQTDATLVDANGADVPLIVIDPGTSKGKREQVWHFNSRAQCMTCHTTWTHYALAFSPPQLNRTEQYQLGHRLISDNQVRSFKHVGLLPEPRPPKAPEDGSPPPNPAPPVVLVDPYEESTSNSLALRARSYLAVNCSVCHRFGGGGTALIDLTSEKDLKEMKLFSPPMLGGFNLPDARIVAPGNAARSVLYYRMAKSGTGRMPRLGCTMNDERGLNLIARWIESLSPDGTPPASPQTVKNEDLQNVALQAVEHETSGDMAMAAIDSLLATTEGSLKLVAAIEDGRVQKPYRALIAERAKASNQETVRDLFARFGPVAVNAIARLGTNPDVAKLLAMPGDAARGRKVFFEVSGGLCSRCHIIDNAGTDFGPNLSAIGAKYNRADLLDNILNPSKTIAEGYETYIARTKGNEAFVGFIVSRTESEIIMKDQTQKRFTIKLGDLEKLVVQPISAMPEGMLGDLEPQQAADLLEFLVNRK